MCIQDICVSTHLFSTDPYGMFDINEDTGRVRYIGPMYEGMRTVTVVVLVRLCLALSRGKCTTTIICMWHIPQLAA